MINTYHTSLAPPPLPPRLNSSHHGSQPVLIPTPVTTGPRGYNRALVRFLVAFAMLHLLMSIVGFIYLYRNSKQHIYPSTTGTDPVHSMQKQPSSQSMNGAPFRALARMVVRQPTTPQLKPRSGFLQWDIKYSRYSHPEINYYDNSWISILESGDYYVYSRVTFSNGNSTTPLTNRVMLRKTKTTKEKIIMQAFCHLDRGASKFSSLCTATAQDVVKLEKGNQLSVWTENLSQIDYEEGATTFGLYSL